jgi:serine phosphatase RsbU (regulator of sigma subunit)
MNLRLRLIVAFFLLSVVPLAAVTFYSYTSNARALRDAAEREADLLAGELGQRMQLVTAQLTERVEHLMDMAELQDAIERQATRPVVVAQVAAPAAPDAAGPDSAPPVAVVSWNDQLAKSIGDAAVLLNNVELRGIRGLRPRPSGGEGGSQPGRRAQPPAGPPGAPPPTPPQTDARDAEDAGAAAGAAPLRIDLGPIRRELFRQILPEGRVENLTPEERQRVGKEINQRLLGIQQGLQLSARALLERAEAVKKQGEEATAGPPPPVAPTPAAPVVDTVRRSALTGNKLDVRVERDGKVVRQVNAELNLPNLLATVFSTTSGDRDEVPFAVGPDGQLFTRSDAERARVEALGPVATPGGPATVRLKDVIVVTTTDPSGSGLKLGIARPLGDSLAELRQTAARNVGFGLLFIGLALAGIVPLSSRLTRNLSVLHEGVRRIARGDYRARVQIDAKDEIGELAQAFNQMAADVEKHQRSAIEQERIKRELELGRRIQNEMLPHGPLLLGPIEIKGVSVPAREVGGDFFNYFELPSGSVALLVGDVSGKGVGAALLMANIQASLRTRLALGQDLSAVADAIDLEIEAGSPGPLYATLFVAILDPVSRRLRYVNAGHNPQYVLRPQGGLERMSSTGLPVGLLAGRGYTEEVVQLASGDVLFFYTDGCVEAESESDEMFGADRLERLLVERDTSGADDVLAEVEREVSRFRGSRELFDDATMMAVKVG